MQNITTGTPQPVLRTSEVSNTGCHAKTYGKAARDLSGGSIEPAPDPGPGVQVIHGTLTMP